MNTIELIKKASDRIIEARPSYQDILEFYSQVFFVQAKSRETIDLAPIKIKDDLLAIALNNNIPLIDPSEFVIDLEPAKALFTSICDLAIEHAPRLSTDAKLIKQALADQTFELKTLYKALLKNQTDVINDLAKKVNVPETHLILFAYLSMTPSIEACSQQFESYLDKDHSHKKAYCPICGNHPDLAFFDENGKRFLKCCYCNHQWAYVRMGCVFCDNKDAEQLQYFFTEQEKEYRVDLCDKCHNYIKVVDTRKMDRAFYPGLEMVSTLHLDIKAREIGYTNQTSIGLG